MRTVLRLMLPLLLLFLVALGQAASAHPSGGQHAQHAPQTTSHHVAAADSACCGDGHSQDEDGKACLAQCLASCTYCAPLPMTAAFPNPTIMPPLPAETAPMHGTTSSPYPRPPSIS